METKVVFTDLSEGKILFPKPIRKFHRKCNDKRKRKSNLKNNADLYIYDNVSKMNLDNITIDEINNDFLSLKQHQEEEKCFEEIYNILSNENNYIPKNKKNQIINSGITNNFFQML